MKYIVKINISEADGKLIPIIDLSKIITSNVNQTRSMRLICDENFGR